MVMYFSLFLYILLSGCESFFKEKPSYVFVTPITQRIPIYKNSNKLEDETSIEKQTLKLLQPYSVLEERTISTKNHKTKTQYLLEDQNKVSLGWVDEQHLYVWNSKPYYKLSFPFSITHDSGIEGFCTEDELQNYLKGTSHPCLQFDLQSVDKHLTQTPLLVVGRHTPAIEENENTFLEVLVPTLYSNMVPVEKNTKITVGLAEIIVFVDASSSMKQEIRDTAKSISDTLIDISKMPNYDIKVMVIAYRDLTDNSECSPVDYIVDENNKPSWVSPAEAVSFLETIETCGDSKKNIFWDALYTLRDIQVTGGAKRALIVIGDTPSWDETQGANIFGTQVPRGLSSSKVLREITKTIGRSSLFIGVVVEKGIQSTFKTLQSELPFSQTQLLSVTKNSSVQQLLTDEIQAYLGPLSSNVKAEEACQHVILLSPDDINQQVPLFCGLVYDESFSRRVADLLVQHDDVVIQKVWISTTPFIESLLEEYP